MKKNRGMDRRQFMITSLAASAGLAAGFKGFSGEPQTKKSNIKVGLYGITLLEVWFRGKGSTVEEQITTAKRTGFDGVEIEGKRPHGNPLDWPTKKCKELRSFADSHGIEIYGTAANNDFSSPMPEFREAQIAYVKELIRMTADMGGKTLRVFLAWPGITKHPQLAQYETAKDIWKYTHAKFSPEETWAWCREGIAETVKYATDAGITVALQNHVPVIKDYRDVLKMVKEINSPNLKVSLDPWALDEKTEAYIQTAARAVGDLQVLCHYGDDIDDRDKDGKVNGAPYYHYFMKAMHDIGYNGYMGYELCHPCPIVNGQQVGIEYAEKKAQEACEFMKRVIKETAKA